MASFSLNFLPPHHLFNPQFENVPLLFIVTHPSTNRTRRWLTSLLRPMMLPTVPNCHQRVLENDFWLLIT